MAGDLVTLVSPSDEVLGSMDKIEAHRGAGVLHRAISVFLFRKNKQGDVELLVQQRSTQKIVGALQWANTACGNVWPGESYEDCARRRLAGELGIVAATLVLTPIIKFEYHVQCNTEFSEYELDQVFAGWYDGPVVPSSDEVAAVEWLPYAAVFQQKAQKDWAPWFVIMRDTASITKKLQEFIL